MKTLRRPTLIDKHASLERQFQLDFRRKRIGPATQKRKIEERFQAFHAANPHVYELLVRIARDFRRAGHARYGMAAIYEIARYIQFSTHSREYLPGSHTPIKLCNEFRALYARLIMERESDLAGFFPTRTRRSE